MFHLNRCKDRLTVGKDYGSCRHNRMHIMHKQSLKMHEQTCPDKISMDDLTHKLKKTVE